MHFQVLNSTYTTISTRFPPSFISDMRLPRDLHRLTSTSTRKMVLTYKKGKKKMQNSHICTIHTNIILCCQHVSPQVLYRKKAYQHNSQHGCNKCPDCIASKSRRQPAAGCERVFITAKWGCKLIWSLTICMANVLNIKSCFDCIKASKCCWYGM